MFDTVVYTETMAIARRVDSRDARQAMSKVVSGRWGGAYARQPTSNVDCLKTRQAMSNVGFWKVGWSVHKAANVKTSTARRRIAREASDVKRRLLKVVEYQDMPES
jgi:hypothetical protein